MSLTTNANLSFGCLFDGDFEFPWIVDKYDGDIEDWWMDINGFVNPIKYPYDVDGNYLDGVTRDLVDNWYSNRSNWLLNNPLPVEMVNYCSDGYPMYILAVKILTAHRGYPVKVDISCLLNEDELYQTLAHFFEKCRIDYDPENIGWWLSSCYY
jgi:hypothetical protein